LPAINFKKKFQLKFKTLAHTLIKQRAMELMNAAGANLLLSKVLAKHLKLPRLSQLVSLLVISSQKKKLHQKKLHSKHFSMQ
jgi:hypothetical protein